MFFPRFQQATMGLFVRALSLGALATPALAGCTEETSSETASWTQYVDMCREDSAQLQKLLSDNNAARVATGLWLDDTACTLTAQDRRRPGSVGSYLKDGLCVYSCSAEDAGNWASISHSVDR